MNERKKAGKELHYAVFGKDSRHSLDQFLSVALHPLRFALRFSGVHKIILNALSPVSTSHAEFLQDRPRIRQNRLTALCVGVSIIQLYSETQEVVTNEL